MTRSTRALLVAVTTGVAALTSALGLGAVLRHAAARTSRAQPPDDAAWVMDAAASSAAVAHGRTLFLNSCAHCHGEDARGDEGPDLHGLEVSNRYIATTVRRGIKGEMPSFAKKHSAEDIRALIAYLRTLQ